VPNIEDEIQSRINSFVAELNGLVRKAALAAVQNALKGDSSPPRQQARPQVRAKRAPQARRAAPLREPSKAARKPGEKRPQAEIRALTERALDYIQRNSGQGVEHIAKGLGTTTRELSLPMKRLLKEKRISAKGEKRATRYFIR
jgi:transcriptional regulator with GAF, ATPase, and Fis domain